mmetsp:Transcript_22361/g.32666  ORF Transcript_22361/g.32666 Transcript_22361/m.32666 type:complete len:100 (-) Transcript_22361:96-395(-)
MDRDDIERRAALMSHEALQSSFRSSSGQFSAIEDILYPWIQMMRRAKLAVPPSLVIAKAKKIAASMDITEDSFKASWQWLKTFRRNEGLGSMHGSANPS